MDKVCVLTFKKCFVFFALVVSHDCYPTYIMFAGSYG